MASTSDIRNGMCIEMMNDIFQVVEFQHVKPGKGAAFVRMRVKSMTTGRVLDQTIPAGHKLDDVRIERRKYQYLYNDEMGFHFMNTESYEQIRLDAAMIESPDMLIENAEVEILFHAAKEMALTIELPTFIVAVVTYTEPGLKGDTATNTLKPATLDTGAEIKVPLFINQGDKIKVDTSTRAYIERVKD